MLSSINRFLKDHPQANLLLVHYPVNPEAPFVLSFPEGSRSLEFNGENKDKICKLCLDFQPDLVLCSGWSNAVYLKIVKLLDKHVRKVLCFDNQWKGNVRQTVNRLLSRIYLLRLFRYAWVPGQAQRVYALKLGFKPERVFTGLYPADTELFSPIGSERLQTRGPYPRNLLCVARYIAQKDLPTLWEAFIHANAISGSHWKLNCIGFGELYEQRMMHPDIVHLGFKQPSEMRPYLQDAGVFVLPSLEEPWGVAVHEMTLCALPLILSDKIGSADMFLKHDNGLLFRAGDVRDLEAVLLKVMNKSDDELWNMAGNSFNYGMQLQTSDWSATLNTISRTP